MTTQLKPLDIENWKTQIRKGYLELCLLSLIHRHERLYGLQILEMLSKADLVVKEGTLYPILSRMTLDGTLSSEWETQLNKGHPRKFYSLTSQGSRLLESMMQEFNRMSKIVKEL